MPQKITELQNQLEKIIKGKKDITDKILMAVLAKGHVLLEDVPGVGKTTTALALSRLMGMEFNRIQFTPDVVPSDVTGFTMYDKQSGQFSYRAGAVMCNLLLADEINRTSPKTQSALLEAMEERRVTVDGVTRPLPTPFICIATQNPLGTTGTQALPSSQLDRFMVRLSIGYPSAEDQIKILKARRYSNPLEEIQVAAQAENILEIQNYLSALKISDDILYYLIRLCEATREHPLVELGISPRGVWALTKMAKAWAILKDRSYVIPEDVQEVFTDVCAHRLILKPQARLEGISEKEILQDILKETKPLKDPKRWNA